ncbi:MULTISPECIES: hypothetical protein [unclassified Guyparkeria]|uniref:hypothetical protein n=1 Tax=unclassified Guyparkeria TaxID=2626246 RepID=UPI00073365FB|nr:MULTISPECIES: hypothetical protein [unclassified Guyparkeria]KTG16451.1 hypothetical protein AUR63_03615 [Guyparkeria sp. XI15]OAE85391.1 hypothetical protein AWR35_03620 [Guyparkeria sp. WRN-7]
MAAEKQRSQSGNQSIVDQDAAITAYLDGLLRDPEQDEPTPSSRSRKTPGLKVIAAETSESAAVETEADEAAKDEVPVPVDAGDAEAEAAVPRDESDEMPSPEVFDTADEPTAESDNPEAQDVAASAALVEEMVSAPDETAATAIDESMVEPEPVRDDVVDEPSDAAPEAADEMMAAMSAEPEAPVEEAEPSPWAWLRVGGMTLAVPAEAVVSRHVDAALDPLPGAPAQVAGALTVDGRPRLILSLANVTGARPRGDDAEVLLLGPGGLWGVLGEPADPPAAFDADAVQWRSESQKAERRGWLAGTHPAAGVAVLDVPGLRAALKGSR